LTDFHKFFFTSRLRTSHLLCRYRRRPRWGRSQRSSRPPSWILEGSYF